MTEYLVTLHVRVTDDKATYIAAADLLHAAGVPLEEAAPVLRDLNGGYDLPNCLVTLVGDIPKGIAGVEFVDVNCEPVEPAAADGYRRDVPGLVVEALVDAALAYDGGRYQVALYDGESDGYPFCVTTTRDRAAILTGLRSTDEELLWLVDPEEPPVTRAAGFVLIWMNGADVVSDFSDNDPGRAIWEAIKPTVEELAG